MKISEIICALERFAALPLQEDYDNAGLQVGLTEADASGALLCLDVNEAVLQEAVDQGCNLVVAHHPLLFRPLRRLSCETQVERCARLAVKHDLCIYAAHTNLDNAPLGVNHALATLLSLTDIRLLRPLPPSSPQGGSGAVGQLPKPMPAMDFLHLLARRCQAPALRYVPGPQRLISRVALCGGAGDFLLPDAVEAGADLFLTGEMGYHHAQGHEHQLWLAALGHYESEQHTITLLEHILRQAAPGLRTVRTSVCTNPFRTLTSE